MVAFYFSRNKQFRIFELLHIKKSLFNFFSQNSDNPCHKLLAKMHILIHFPLPPVINVDLKLLAKKNIDIGGRGRGMK
jgi:hypothetical protein